MTEKIVSGERLDKACPFKYLSEYGKQNTVVSYRKGYTSRSQKTYLRTCPLSDNSDQHVLSRSLIMIFTGRILAMIANDPKFLHVDKED